MSIQDLQVKNDYNLYCNTITPATGGTGGPTGATGPTGPSPTILVNSQSWPVYASQTGPVNTQIVFTKVGRVVSVAMPSWNATQTSPGGVTIGSMNLPSDFYPSTAYNSGISSGDIYFSMSMSDNMVSQTALLDFSAEPENLPAITFYINTPSGGQFSGTGDLIQECFSFTYSTDS